MLILRVALAAAVATLAIAGSTALASNSYSPVGVCGSGFHVIDQHKLKGPKGGWFGTAYLLYNGRSGRNCAVFIKRRAAGKPTFTEVSLAAKGGRYKADNGDYRYYAGPLYVHAPGRCVIYGARMNDARGNGGSWITPHFGHCGR
jgi:hypothetical protein